MRIVVTNDDGYNAKGIETLAEIMRAFGDVTIVAPKTHQSGMSMAVSLGAKPIATKKVAEEQAKYNSNGDKVKGSLTTYYVDATPASCVKFALDILFLDNRPDVIVSGINHGSNAASASCYSGTLGACQEGVINSVPAIGVSLDSYSHDPDFSAVQAIFPSIFSTIMANLPDRPEIYYNVNFPDIPQSEILGIRVGHQGRGHWVKEFEPWDPEFYAAHSTTPVQKIRELAPSIEEGESLWMMVGDFVDDENNDDFADHRLNKAGYISIVAHNLDTTDYQEITRLKSIAFDKNFCSGTTSQG